MFFVEKKNKNSRNSVLQLMKSERINGKPRQIIVLSLGADYPIPKELRKKVAKAVTDRLKGQMDLFISPEIERYTENIVWRLQQKQNSKYSEILNKYDEIREVYVNRIKHSEDRLAGPVIIGDAAWKMLKFDTILENIGFSERDRKIAEISILNRLISQSHEYAIPSWIKTYSVSDIIYPKAEDLGKDIFYRISDKLLSNRNKIEKFVYRNAKSLFSLESSIILYDLTNTYFEGNSLLNPKAEFGGNQKEKRTDCRQIVIALMLDIDGFVISHKIFNGKMSDAKSLKKILKSIEYSYLGKENVPTLIFDRGVTSEDNLNLLRSSGLNYIVASRNNLENAYSSDFMEADFMSINQEGNSRVDVYLKKENDENFLLCKSEGRKRKEESMRTKKEERFIGELEKLRESVFKRRIGDISEISQKIGRLREKYSMIAQFYDVRYEPFSFDFEVKSGERISKKVFNILASRREKFYTNRISYNELKRDLEKYSKKYHTEFQKIDIEFEKPKLNWITLEEKRKFRLNMEGNYLLRTNRDDLDATTFWKIYTMLTKIEHAFRHLKSDLGLRPNYHHLGSRVEGHIFISILAYQLLQTIEYTLRQTGCTLSWNTVKRLMVSHTYSTIVIPTRDGKVIRLRKAGEPEQVQKSLYQKLRIDYKKLPITKIIGK